jgi:hypothetical protein
MDLAGSSPRHPAHVELGAALGFDDRRGVEREGVRGRARARRPARADGGSGERGIRNSVGEARQWRFD